MVVSWARFYDSEVKYSGATNSARIPYFRSETCTDVNFTPEVGYSLVTFCTGVFYSVLINLGQPKIPVGCQDRKSGVSVK